MKNHIPDSADLDSVAQRPAPGWRLYINSLIAAEISKVSQYFERLIFFGNASDDNGLVYSLVKAPTKRSESSLVDLVAALNPSDSYSAVLLNGTANHAFDIEGTLSSMRAKMNRTSRIIWILYKPYLNWLYRLVNRLFHLSSHVGEATLTMTAVSNIATLSGLEIVRVRHVGFLPWPIGGIGTLVNRVLAAIPVLRKFSYVWILYLRPSQISSPQPTLSIVIPARNERGNIEAAITRLPEFPSSVEILFVEGHSTDGTWEEIQRVSQVYKDRHIIRSMQQRGTGKSDAVRLGFSQATGEVLTILDADLTMPPEFLLRFYDAYRSGLADFVNGNRLVYPMEGKAMRFLNWLGNIFFAKALSVALDTSLGDSLCGTKLFSRRDYDRFCQWRHEFGDFDPFGDFELLFPACELAVGVLDLPIRYRDRAYGSTKIRRFYHGSILLKMTLIGLARIRLGAAPE
jgi:hypothetical protein